MSKYLFASLRKNWIVLTSESVNVVFLVIVAWAIYTLMSVTQTPLFERSLVNIESVALQSAGFLTEAEQRELEEQRRLEEVGAHLRQQTRDYFADAIPNNSWLARIVKANLTAPPMMPVAHEMARARFGDDEVACLADNLYGETRGEDLTGQVAVALVTLNRVAAHYNGDNTICDVIRDVQNGTHMFSWRASFAEAPRNATWRALHHVSRSVLGLSGDLDVMREVAELTPVLAGVTHFYAPSGVEGGRPSWHNYRMEWVTTIGGHRFLRYHDHRTRFNWSGRLPALVGVVGDGTL